MEKIWFAHYPKGIPHEVNPEQYQSIVSVFEEACRKYADRPAFTNMGTVLTYAELHQKAKDFAAFLQNDLKLKKDDRIGIQLPNLLQYPIVQFGAMMAGLIIVNTNPLYSEREMKHQFNDAGCKVVVILANFAHHLQSILHETKIEHVIVTEIGDLMLFPKNLLINFVIRHIKKMVPAFSLPKSISFIEAMKRGARQSYQPVKIDFNDIAFLQYTGGTTGVSKGAMLTHRNIISNMLQICVWMTPKLIEGQEVAICALPLYHIFCLTVNSLAFLRFGGNNIMITNPKDIPAFIKVLRKTPFSIMTGVNTLYNALMLNPEFSKLDFSHLKVSVAGGMALQTSVAARWKLLTGTPVVEGYGLTETSPVATCNPIDGTDRPGTIGLPLPSTEIRICDDDGNEVKDGESGEICIKGPQVMKGYWQRQDETDLVLTKDGWLKTGDIAVIDKDGFAKIVDRKKDMILVSGFNVYPNEVEDVIATHPGVAEVAAIGIPDEKSGEAVKIVVVKKDPALTAESLITHARNGLAGYKVPKKVEFRTELPKTNVGKILRRALRESTTQT